MSAPPPLPSTKAKRSASKSLLPVLCVLAVVAVVGVLLMKGRQDAADIRAKTATRVEQSNKALRNSELSRQCATDTRRGNTHSDACKSVR